MRYLLTLKGRPPFRSRRSGDPRTTPQRCGEPRLAGHTMNHVSPNCIKVPDGVSPFAETYQDIQLLAPPGSVTSPTSRNPCPRTPPRCGHRRHPGSYLDTVQRQLEAIPTLETFGRHLDTVSRSYWPGLFHCYAIPGLPRTNNEVESHFRETRRRLLRTTGQQGKRSGRCNARASGNSCPTRQQRRSYRRSSVKPLRRTWRRSGNVLLNIASVSAGRAVP